MGHVTKALLEIELAELRKQYQGTLDHANSLGGAIQFAEHLLKTISGETIIPAEPEASEDA